MGEVYLAINRINGKCYVGLTTRTMQHRMVEHLELANQGGGYSFHDAIRRSGWVNFSWCVLHRCEDPNQLALLEMKAIKSWKARYPLGYNHTAGGELPDYLKKAEFRPVLTDRGFLLNMFVEFYHALRSASRRPPAD
jgi:predicted GIY-YIG superfamily endonuclease